MTEESYIEDVIRPNLLQTKLAEAVAAQDTEVRATTLRSPRPRP